MRILITGGAGMVGSNVLEHPAANQYEVLAPTHAELDLLDRGATERQLAAIKPDLVIHCAGRVGGIQANIREPVAFLADNWDMGRNIVLAARDAGAAKLINLGSSCMYPRDAENPLREEMVLTGLPEPTNEGYALAKIAIARLCAYVNRETPQCSYKTLLPCNIYGRHDSFDPARSHLIPAILHKLHHARRREEKTVDIWGDGLARREFMYGGDLADAIWHAVGHFDDLPEMMNLGTGEDHTVNDYYRAAAKVVGYAGAFRHDLSKPAGMARKLVDVSRARALGWHASTALRDGLMQTYRYYLESEYAQ